MILKKWLRTRLGQPAAGAAGAVRPLSELAFAVLDVDLSGTDRQADDVLGVAVLPVTEGAFRLADLRYCRFPTRHQEAAVAAPDLQRDYAGVLDLLANRTILTYNPRFVAWMLTESARRLGLPAPPGDWLDIASAAAVVGFDGVDATSMAYWLRKMKTGGRQEHDAVYDVFALAQLLQGVLAYADEMGIETLADLVRNQKARDWMRPY